MPDAADAVALVAHRPAADAPLPPSATPGRGDAPRRFYSSAQWTADGTTLLVASSDRAVAAFALPADLLSADGPRRPEPQAEVRLPEPTQAMAAAPFFSLAEPASQTFLVGCRDHPLHLYHAFPGQAAPAPLATYKLVRRETEEHLTPASLVWPRPGTHFVCGSASRLDCFDVSRPGADGPVLTLPTIPSRRHVAKGGGVGMKGTVAALAASPEDAPGGSLVAAGTRTRWIGLYDLRSDRAVANWAVSRAGDAAFDFAHDGQGIVQLVWSPCGRYLVVNERRAGCLLVYDIRGTGKLLSALGGRTSSTQQRLACDVYQGDAYDNAGFEVWAGSQHGSVLVWEGVGRDGGLAEPSWGWKAHESPIGSTALHSCGAVAATCSGAWEHADHVGGGCRTLDESSLKVWSIGAQDMHKGGGLDSKDASH